MLELDEGKLSRPVLRRGSGSNPASLSRRWLGNHWLYPEAHQAEAINHHLLRNLPVTQVQLDAMWNCIGRKHAQETDAAGESVPDSADGRQWVWVSFAPECRLMLTAIVGPRTLDTAKEVVAVTKARVAGYPGVLQRRLHVLSGGPNRCLPCRDDVCAHGEARAAPQAPLRAPSRCGLRAIGHTETSRQAADTQYARRGWHRTSDPSGPSHQHGFGRRSHLDLAAVRGPLGAEDIELLSRPRAAATAGGLFPGLLQ